VELIKVSESDIQIELNFNVTILIYLAKFIENALEFVRTQP
jgi:hypothetical protein